MTYGIQGVYTKRGMCKHPLLVIGILHNQLQDGKHTCCYLEWYSLQIKLAPADLAIFCYPRGDGGLRRSRRLALPLQGL